MNKKTVVLVGMVLASCLRCYGSSHHEENHYAALKKGDVAQWGHTAKTAKRSTARRAGESLPTPRGKKCSLKPGAQVKRDAQVGAALWYARTGAVQFDSPLNTRVRRDQERQVGSDGMSQVFSWQEDSGALSVKPTGTKYAHSGKHWSGEGVAGVLTGGKESSN